MQFMNNQELTCQYKDHENEPIIGFCLNSECQEINKYCSQCILNKHLTHSKDCKSLNQIKHLIQNTLKIIDKWQAKTLHDIQRVNELYKDITSFLNTQQKKVMDLKMKFDNQEFQELDRSTVALITYYEIQKTDQQICSKNQLDQLEKWHKFCKSLNDLDNSSHQEKHQISENKENQYQIYYQRGKLQYNNNLLAEALSSFEKCIQINPQHKKAHIYKGMKFNIIGCILNDLLRFEEAIKCYDDVLKLDSQNTAALNNKGLALSQLSRLEEAQVCFETILNLDPYDEYALINIGVTLNNQHKEAEAKVYFQKALLKNRELTLLGYKLSKDEEKTQDEIEKRIEECYLLEEPESAFDENFNKELENQQQHYEQFEWNYIKKPKQSIEQEKSELFLEFQPPEFQHYDQDNGY